MRVRLAAVGLLVAGCAHSNDSPRAEATPTGSTTAAAAPPPAVAPWTRVAAGSALDDSAYPADPVPRPEAVPIDHFGRESTPVPDGCSAFVRFELPSGATLATHTIDNTIESIVPLVPSDDDGGYRSFVVTLAGSIVETDAPDRTPVTRTLTAAADRELLVSVPAGVAPDFHVGQHLRGRVVFEDDGIARDSSVDLSDDAGVVLQIDPHSIRTVLEPDASPGYSDGPKRPPHKDDRPYEVRHAVLAKLPGGTAPIVLDGWTRRTTPAGTFDACGQSMSLKPGAQVYDYFGGVVFDLVRVPKLDALAGQVHPVLAYDAGKGDAIAAIPPTVAELPGHQGSLSFSITAFDRPLGEGCTGPLTREIDGTVEAIGKLRGNWSDAEHYGWSHYVVRFAGGVTENGKPVDPRLLVELSRGNSLDLAVGRHVHGKLSVCPSREHHVELYDDAGLLAAFAWMPSPSATAQLGSSGISVALPPASTDAGVDQDSLAIKLPDGTQVVQHGWSRWRNGTTEYAIHAERYVLDPPYEKTHTDSLTLGVVRLAR
jgi:hypothetical protein